MISERDTRFHPSPDNNPDWAETNFFSFYIPEHNLTGSVYLTTRQSLGVCMSDILMFNTLSFDRQDCLFVDARQHLPLPEDLSDYSLANGLSIRALSPPRDYAIRFVQPELEMDLRFTALMDPYDINDPVKDPLARREGRAGLSFYGGHFDMTGRVTGTVTYKGTKLQVDCVDTMDHSWGVRPQVGSRSACWMHAHFDEDAVQATMLFDPAAKPEDQFTLYRGYILKDGVVSGLVRARLIAHRLRSVAVTLEWEVEDEMGRIFKMQGGAVSFTTVPWYSYSKSFYVMHRFVLDDGRVGYGCHQEAQNLDQLCLENNI
jgi:hypothetical protein